VASALVLTVAAIAAIAAGTARAGSTPVGLPSPVQQLTASPPLTGAAGVSELRVPGRVTSRQRILVGIGPDGAPRSVHALQRLVLIGKGDYSFIVPGPLTDVLPGTGTDSQPGFRTDAIVWQGFSPGRRVLAALVTLRARDTAPSLPVRVSLRTTVGGRELRPGEQRSGPLVLELAVQNITPAPIVTFAATGVPIELAGVLDGLRQTIESGTPYMSYVATILSKPKPLKRRYEAVFAVQGSIRFPRGRVGGLRVTGGRPIAGRVEFRGRLGEDAPLRLSLRITGRAIDLSPPRLELQVTPDLDLHALRPPLGRTWKEAVRRKLVQIDGRELLDTTIATLLRVSRTRQYEIFLTNPDTFFRAGGDRSVYLYRTVAAPRAVALPPASGGGADTLLVVLLAAGGAVLAGGLVVLWAHS
jgi:hypothetical protein